MLPQEKPKKRVRKAATKQKDLIQAALKKTDAMPSKKVKHRNEITRCPHVNGVYYASGMCKNCYHCKGRNKLATLCEHTDRKLYARGVCKACYLRQYHNRTKSAKDPAAGQQNLSLQIRVSEHGKPKDAQTLPLFDGSDHVLTYIDASHDATFELNEQDSHSSGHRNRFPQMCA